MRDFTPFLLFLFGLAVVLRVDFFFTIVYFLVGSFVLARLWTRRVSERLRVGRQLTDRAFTGDDVTVTLSIQNASLLPLPWIEVRESVPLALQAAPFRNRAISLAGHETWRDSYTLFCRRRGYYPVGPLTLETGDLLGLERRSILRVEPARMLVYPRVVPLHELGIPTRSPLVALPAKSPLFEDPSRLMGVRDYRRGDSPRRIHWPATARTGSLVVKQYQPAVARETMICLDMSRENYNKRRTYEATELAIVAAASLANHIVVREALPVGLATDALDPVPEETRRISVPPRSERAHLMHGVLETLARIQTTGADTLTDLLRAEGVRLGWGGTLLVITGRETDALYETLVYLRRSGLALALVLVHPEPTPPELLGRAEALRVPVYRVRTERDLETWT